MSRYESTQYEYIFRDKNSGKLYFRGTVFGKFIDRSLKTDKITLAKSRSDLIRREPDQIRIIKHTFDESFDLVLKIQSPKAENTYQMARRQIDLHLRPWFTLHCPYLHEFERDYEEKWAEYITFQRNKDPDRQLKHDRRHLVMTLLRAYNKKWVKREFASKDLPLLEATEPIGKHIEDDDIKHLLEFLKSHEDIYLQVLIAVTMGMRISEILHLRKEEVNLIKREIDLDPKRLKIRRPREIPIPISNVVYPLLKAAYDASLGEFIFPAWYGGQHGYSDYSKPQNDNSYWWDIAREKLNLDIRFHDLRHTAITNALAAGLPSITAQKIFGATEKTIRRIYDHMKKDIKTHFQSIYDGKFTE